MLSSYPLQGGTEWGIPEVVAGLPDGCGVASIAAGARASAAVTVDGQLWMWGRLLAADNTRCGSQAHILELGSCNRLPRPQANWLLSF